ncbi:MAG: isoleucine--tRNA ligase, partial [Planctomycetota bacterium]
MFQEVPKNVNFPELETQVLEFWKANDIYQKTLERRANAERFVFFEGPPTANGKPHPGHCLTRAIKDLFPRYKTMRGYLCERKAGWDTHGLPVEVEVCKEMGIHSKEDIEKFGVEPFIQKCQQSVWRYMQEWERLTERLGFWVNLEKAYVTYHQSYVESVWWSLKNLFDRNLLYQGHKIVWWWAQGGTALSAGEVGQGYREVADPSIYVRFPLVDDPDTALLVWTTTPWTMPSNQFAAVNPGLDYAVAVDAETNQKLIMAEALVEAIAGKTKRELTVESTMKGSELIGKRYVPPFDYYYKDHGDRQAANSDGQQQHVAWRVVPAEFVTTDSGSGVVHQAPAFGEVDYEVLMAEQQRFPAGDGPELICAVGPDGKFTDEAPDYKGRWVKEADKDISRELKSRDVLYHQEQYLHDYPFCWRAEKDPLIQYPRRSWFVRTTQFKDRLIANNKEINWLPEHIRDGRFGNFLESNVDWALSRERYWGTPLPVWVCEETGYQEAIGSYDELLAKPGMTGNEVWENAKSANPELADDLRVHKPYIDAITYDSPKADGARMRRVPEVIDCWYDSGAMPFAQWGYPHQNKEEFAAQFPADFISEALDQTRGWFYSLLAISSLVFDKEGGTDTVASYPHPFRNCIVLGLMLSEWYEDNDSKVYLTEEDARASGGKYKHTVGKMSKSKRNYREPQEIFDRYGADALRWYFFANQAPWTSIRYSERSIKDSIPEFILRLWNVYSFFVIYARIDEFNPAASGSADVGDLDSAAFTGAAGYRPVSERSELDRWIMSELNRTIAQVIEKMDAYDNYGAAGVLNAFVDGLSNWYVRRSRDRYWAKDKTDQAKLDAYWTLYECLLNTTRLIAPFTPFVADNLWQNLAVATFGDKATASVHLCDYPSVDNAAIDNDLSEQMRLAREISSLGRAARMNAKLKVRQPLAKVEVILASDAHLEWLRSHASLISEELNVRDVNFSLDATEYIQYQVKPNFKKLGPLLGKNMPEVKKLLTAADGGELLGQLDSTGEIVLTLSDGSTSTLTREHVEVDIEAREGWAASQGNGCVVVLATELTPELIRSGYANDLVRFIQDRRKAMDLDYTDRIDVGIETSDEEVKMAITENHDFIAGETLANSIVFERHPRSPRRHSPTPCSGAQERRSPSRRACQRRG